MVCALGEMEEAVVVEMCFGIGCGGRGKSAVVKGKSAAAEVSADT